MGFADTAGQRCQCGHQRREHKNGQDACNQTCHNPSTHEADPCSCQKFVEKVGFSHVDHTLTPRVEPRRNTSPELDEVNRIAKLLIAEWIRIENVRGGSALLSPSSEINPAFVSNFVDLARVVIADQIAKAGMKAFHNEPAELPPLTISKRGLSSLTISKRGLSFVEAFKQGKPIRRYRDIGLIINTPWYVLGELGALSTNPNPWIRIDTGERCTLRREDYLADDWEAMT